MSSVLGLLTTNAPLKLAAIVVAVVLYGGLVFSQNVRVWPGPVPIDPIGQGADVFVLEIAPQAVTSIRFVAPASVTGAVSGQTFRAAVDLTDVAPGVAGAPVSAPVRVEALDPRIQVTDWSPRFVSVRLDSVVTRTAVPVRVDRGEVPEGVTIGDPEVSAASASARGPASVVGRVAAAIARVRIDASGVDVDQDVDLVAVDARGDQLTPIDFEPSRVHVRIAVGVSGTTRTVPVVAIVGGTPATGYAITGISVQPVTVVIAGPRTILEGVDHLDTESVDVAGARADVRESATLVLPEGVSLLGGAGSVQVDVTVVPLTGSRTFSVAVVLGGTSDAYAYSLSTGSTLAVISGRMVTLNNLQGASLQAVADVSGLGPGSHPVTLSVALPSGLTLASLTPTQVTVTIANVATPAPTATP